MEASLMWRSRRSTRTITTTITCNRCAGKSYPFFCAPWI